MATAILHIGFNKCGSTAIQSWLADRRDALADHGFRFERSDPRPNVVCNDPQISMLAHDLAGELARSLPIYRVLGIDPDAPDAKDVQHALARSYRIGVEDRVRRHPDDTFLFSSEYLTARILRGRQIACLADWLCDTFASVRVLAYIRRPEDWIISQHGQTRRQKMPSETLTDFALRVRTAGFARMLRQWHDALGPRRVAVRLFQERWLTNNGLIADFAEAIGYAGPRGGRRQALLNTGYRAMGGWRSLMPTRLNGRTERPRLDQTAQEVVAQANAADMSWIEDTYFADRRPAFRAWRAAASQFRKTEK